MKDKFVITVSREYGSGGGEIGRRLAEYFNIPCYDKELLTIVAKESGYCKEYFEKFDEKPMKVLSYFGFDNSVNVLPANHQLFLKQFNLIQKLAKEESCVFVGRAADYALRDYDNVINVFVHGKFEFRRKRAVEHHGIEEKVSANVVKKIDKERASYYKYYTDSTWGMATNYDISLDTSSIGIEEAIKLIINFVERKYKLL
ncbi:MAG: cytidylate kinase-like family protein [Terrisporobacter sp.]|uniref:cytidylate kinase-like family protein n=1 Tax=Terrisporobacter sp. TaxID=1965305 RepID=UPI002FC6F8C3